jgi:hypothetical protein
MVSTGIEVDYDDAKHRYSYNGVRYLSATQLVEHFTNKFDTEERIVYMSERYGETPEYWRKKWKDNNTVSLIRGDGIHSAREEYLYGAGVDVSSGRVLQVRNRNLWPANYPYAQLPDGTYPELKLWRHDVMIAGRADKVIFTTATPGTILARIKPGTRNRVADLEDYKTNKKIRKYSHQDAMTKQYLMMTGPLSYLMDCEISHYSLQLSIYQYMLEYHGFTPGHRRIIHYQHEIEGLGIPKPVTIDLPYLRDEVIAMIAHINQAA